MNKEELADYKFNSTKHIFINNLGIQHINLIKECTDVFCTNRLATRLVSYTDTKLTFYTCNSFNKHTVKQQLESIVNKYKITVQLNVLVVEANEQD